ncbi:MAG: glutathione S-transferase family protein [Betaproteobacteria bacterium]|nr:glutathione S-transferase family protein [Betaproteobacteria bacterium]
MLKIWGRLNSINVQKVLWCCAELKLKYERVDAGMQFGVNNTPEYLAMNPNGLVPTINDDGLILWESHAIVRYLSRKHGKGTLWPTDEKACADADRWMEWYSTTVWPNLRPVFWNLVRMAPDKRDMAAVEDGRKKLAANFDIVNRHLASRQYIAGGALTMGDIPMGVAVHRWFALPIERPAHPNLEAYYGRLKQRAGYKEFCALPLT